MNLLSNIERQEIRSLHPGQKTTLFRAINQLKQNGIYDKFVNWHGLAMMTKAGTELFGSIRNLAHYSPVFLPWHREYLIRFENALREIDTSISLPYWDWTIDAELQDPSTSIIWTEDILGGRNPTQNGLVTDGPFKNWKFSLNIPGYPREAYLRRDFDNTIQLPFRRDVELVINNNELEYDKYPWDGNQDYNSFRIILERPIHNPVHNWVGGTMEEAYSPGDPVFFLHHCNIDRVWANWQRKHNYLDRYPANDKIRDRRGRIIPFTNRNHKMFPWNDINDNTHKKVQQVLDFTQYYEYKEYYVS